MSYPFSPSSPASTSTSTFPSSSSTNKDRPITRSRTLFYLSIRDSSTSFSSRKSRRGGRSDGREYGELNDYEGEEGVGLIERTEGGRGGSVGVQIKGLPPKWVDISEEVEDLLSRAKLKITTLDKLHAKHVLPGFTDRTAEEREIERQTTDITRDFRKCTTLISSIQPTKGSQVETITAKNVQRGLAGKVQESSAMFRKKQRVYMQKLQGHAIKNKDLLAASGAITLRGADSFDELEADEEASKTQLQSQTQTQTQTLSQPQSTLNIDQRTHEISQIASSITELADLFRDLGGMIVEQGTVLDSVEYNVSLAARELESGVGELKVAQRYQSNTGRRKCILLLLLIILGLILVLIYKPRGNPNPQPSPPQSDGTSGGGHGGMTKPPYIGVPSVIS